MEEVQTDFAVGNSEELTTASEGAVRMHQGSRAAAELEVSVVVCSSAAVAGNWRFGFAVSIGEPQQNANQQVQSVENLVVQRKVD